jgi:hypothetical protein
MDLNKKTDVENEGGNEPLKTNPGDDINVNLGKFGNEVPNEQPNLVTPNPTLAAQAMEDTDQKKERKFKIDFERFNRRKQVSSNNSLSLKMDS